MGSAHKLNSVGLAELGSSVCTECETAASHVTAETIVLGGVRPQQTVNNLTIIAIEDSLTVL